MKELLHGVSLRVPAAMPARLGVIMIAAWCLRSAPLVCAQESALSRPSTQQQNPSSTTQTEKYQAAAKEYETLLKAQPKSAKLWSNLGAVQAMQGDCPASLASLKHARALDPGLFAPWYFSGYCHLAFHQDRTALEELQRATSLNSKDPNAWYLEAQAAAGASQLALSFDAVLRSLLLDSRRPEGYYLAGQDALGIAKEQYDYIVGHQPSPFALRLRAERNAGGGVWAAAAADYQKARELSPGAPDIAFELGSVYLEKGDYAEAENEFHNCLDQLSDSAWAKLRLALALAAQSKNNQAEEILKNVQPASLVSPFEWEDLIAAEDLLGQRESARHLLSQAESLFPNSPDWDGWTQRLAGEGTIPGAPPQASFEFERPGEIGLSVSFLLASGPEHADFLRPVFPSPTGFRSFRAAFLSGNTLAASAQLTPLIRERPSDSGRAFVVGEILHRLALGFFERLETQYSDSEPAMVLAAENYSAIGDQTKAIEIYQSLLRNDGPSPDILRDLAKVYWKQHQWDETLPLLQQLAKLDPYDATIFINLGRIYSYQQNLNEAEENFHIAARIQPDMYEAHLGLGEILERAGQMKGAITELKVAERVQPANPRPHYLLAQLYRKVGEKSLASEEMANFQRLQALAGPESADKAGGLVPLD